MKRKGIIALLLAMSIPFGYAFGQAGVTGSILGRVSDATDAAIPGATVTVIDTATGAKRVLKTNDAGEYTLPELPTGPYTVRVEAPGFGVRTIN